MFAIFAKYEILFLRMSFKEPQNRIIKLKHRIKVVMACKLSYGKIRRFLCSYVPQMYTTMDNSNFDEIINTFKTDKQIKLATYASRCIENEILMYLRKNNSQKIVISFDEPLNIDWDGNELLLGDVLGTDDDSVDRHLEEEVEKELLHSAMDSLCVREKQIMQMRYGLFGTKEKTQKEVADMLGISQSYISRLEKRIISRLKNEISKKI